MKEKSMNRNTSEWVAGRIEGVAVQLCTVKMRAYIHTAWLSCNSHLLPLFS